MWIEVENAVLFLKVKKDDKLRVYLRSPSDVNILLDFWRWFPTFLKF